LPQYSEPFN